MRMVIVGPGRSGTRHTAALLTACGVPCGHEQVANPSTILRGGQPDWGDRLVEASWMASHEPRQWAPLVGLQLRHPLRVAASRLAYGTFRAEAATVDSRTYQRVIARQFPWVLRRPTEESRILAHLLATTSPAAADLIWRVEDGVPVEAIAGMVGAIPTGGATAPADAGHRLPTISVDEAHDLFTRCPEWPEVKALYSLWYPL
jgi:hypothetical protein